MSFTATSPSPRTAAPVIATAPRSNLRSPYRPCRQQTENRGRRGGELLGPRKPHKSLGVTFDFAPYAGEGRPLPPEPVAGATW